MKPRKKQPEATRHALLAAAGAEFSRHGYAGSALGAIAAAAGLTKGALFHHFPDKRSLAAAWIADNLAVGIRAVWLEPLDAATTLGEVKSLCRNRISAITAGDATATLAALATELGQSGDLLAEGIADIFEAWHAAAAAAISRARDGGSVFRNVVPENEAGMLVSLITGIAVRSVLGSSPFRQAAIRSLEDYLDTLRPS